MTDKTISLVVSLEQELRMDDVQGIIDDIKHIRYVADVTHNVFDGTDQVNAWAIKNNFINNLIKNLIEIVNNEKIKF